MWTEKRAIAYAKKRVPKAKYFWVQQQGYVTFQFCKDGTQHRFHRYITKKRRKKKLRIDQHVHHIDHDRLNNIPENLQILSITNHNAYHPRTWTKKQRRDFSKARTGEGNPNYGNHAKRRPRTESEKESMRKNQPTYVHVEKSDLERAIEKYQRPVLVQRALGITAKVYTNRCKLWRLGSYS